MEETITTGATDEDAIGGDSAVAIVAYHPVFNFVGEVVRLGAGSVTFGRDYPDSGLSLQNDRRMSRCHAEIIRLREQIVIRDLRSRNGTWVNGERIEHTTLKDGDIVRLGTIVLVIRWLDRSVPRRPNRSKFLGVGQRVRELMLRVEEFGTTSAVVLLQGEPGVGKGLIAREIHQQSNSDGPFITFDCGAVAPGVMHSELFGHRAGAFSGAKQARAGLIHRAQGGTLFLDEIGDSSPELQSSLLRLLEEGEYRPVGSDRVVRSQARVIAATNRDLDHRVEKELFRFDLLTRLRRLTLEIPPLRDRVEDILFIATHFARRRLGPTATIHRRLATALMDHPWPGNVRELDAVIERACLVTQHDRIVRWQPDLLPKPRPNTNVAISPKIPSKQKTKPDKPELERLLIEYSGNITHLAVDLGVARHTLYRWIKRAGISLEDYR